jgi:hypothetical protein
MQNTELRTTSRIAVVSGAEPADWRKLYDRIDGRPVGLTVFLANASVVVVTLGTLLAVAMCMAWGIWKIYPGIAMHVLACFVVPPAFLCAAAGGQGAGNLFFRIWFGMDNAARRGFAARLTLGNAPEQWPGMVRRWLFSGNWLGAPACDHRFPYMRIFVLGDAPATCAEEDAIWRDVHQALCGDARIESGCNHREISYPAELPKWSRHAGAGDGLDALRARIGALAADEWVAHLWSRANRQWPALGESAFPAAERRDCFEMRHLSLPGGREGLAVILRPPVMPEAAIIAERMHAAAA